MRNLIVYSTMYGCTEKCANNIKEKLKGDTVVINVENKSIPQLNEFDNVVLGSSIKVGKIGKSLSKYIEKNKEELMRKRLGIFVCGGDNETDYLKQNFPEDIYNKSVIKEFVGGEISMDKVGFLMGMVLKMVGKYESYSRIDHSKIEKIAEYLNN